MSAQPAGLAVSVTVVNELQEEGGLTIVWLKATAESSSQSVACAWDWTDGRLDTRPSLQTVVSHSTAARASSPRGSWRSTTRARERRIR